MAPELPCRDRDEIEAWFTAVLAGTCTRDETDRWAAQWCTGAAGSAVGDEVVRWALDLLHGIDLPAGPDGDFLHDDDQVRQWLDDFRIRCAIPPARDGT